MKLVAALVSLLQVTGLILVCVGGFMLSVPAGLIVAGVTLVVVSLAVEAGVR